jgi:hypothetical protein
VILVRVLLAAVGMAAALGTVLSAVHTFVLPRAAPVRISRTVFVMSRWCFARAAGWRSTYLERDRIMALYAPLTLLVLPVVWLAVVLGGYTLLFWAVEGVGWREAFDESGSSLLTLGFARPRSALGSAIAFSEAALGIGLLALLITYLPTMYAAFNRREAMVALLEVRAGSPPSAVEMLVRVHRIGYLGDLDEIWPAWEAWFADLDESHTSLPALPFYRSPQPDRSWVTAAGAVLDAAALSVAAVERPPSPRAQLCIRSGFIALRHIADYFGIAHDPNPSAEDPIAVTRDEFEGACDRMAAAGVPLKADRDAAWRAFAGWRVNYDAVLLALAALTMPPVAEWSSDRAPAYRRPPLRQRRRRRSPAAPI